MAVQHAEHGPHQFRGAVTEPVSDASLRTISNTARPRQAVASIVDRHLVARSTALPPFRDWAISTRDSPRARSVATSRSRAVAPNASRRTVAERAALARSITLATRPSEAEPGRDAWRVTQLSWAGTVTTFAPPWAARGALRTNPASESTAAGMSSSA
ncbi:MAG TPA: hypothetical protein VIY73_11560 [Polyangiaceae bacterium]